MNAVEIYEKASWDLEHSKITLGEFEERIKALYDVEPVRHGRWLDRTQRPGWPDAECSACGSHAGMFWMNYCPNCGARMDSESDE